MPLAVSLQYPTFLVDKGLSPLVIVRRIPQRILVVDFDRFVRTDESLDQLAVVPFFSLALTAQLLDLAIALASSVFGSAASREQGQATRPASAAGK